SAAWRGGAPPSSIPGAPACRGRGRARRRSGTGTWGPGSRASAGRRPGCGAAPSARGAGTRSAGSRTAWRARRARGRRRRTRAGAGRRERPRSEALPRAKRPHGGEDPRGIVSHDRMAGAPYLRHLAAAELTGETRSRLRGEDRALRAAHQERRTLDLPDGVPELLEVGLQPPAADRGIELV